MQLKQVVWQVAIRNKPCGTILKEKNTPFVKVPNPVGMWAADPFLIEKEDELYIFAELFSLLEWKGKIGYCVFYKGKFSPWKIIFDEAPHYSYPYVFEYNNEIYMMPETGSLKEIAIYKAVNFPTEWKKEKVLFCGNRMVDSIFLSKEKILSYKMVGNFKNQLVYIKKEDENWVVEKSEADSNETKRPGGKIFDFEKTRVRPAQDGRKLYGGSLKFLCVDEEIEKEIGELKPEEIKVNNFHKKIVGTHTYNATSNYEVIDLQYYKFTLLGFLKRLLLKLSKLGR